MYDRVFDCSLSHAKLTLNEKLKKIKIFSCAYAPQRILADRFDRGSKNKKKLKKRSIISIKMSSDYYE